MALIIRIIFWLVYIIIIVTFTACNSSTVDPYFQTLCGVHLKMDHYWYNKVEHIIIHRELCPYGHGSVEYDLTVDNIKSRYTNAEIDLCTYCKP